MHQVLYIVQLPNEEGDMNIIWYIHYDMPCDPNLVFSAQSLYSLSKLQIYLPVMYC